MSAKPLPPSYKHTINSDPAKQAFIGKVILIDRVLDIWIDYEKDRYIVRYGDEENHFHWATKEEVEKHDDHKDIVDIGPLIVFVNSWLRYMVKSKKDD